MVTRKIVLKTAKARKGTVTRTAIRKAVQAVFGVARSTKPAQTAKTMSLKKAKGGILQAQ